MSSIQLNFLGPAQLIRDGAPISAITSPKALALLAYLALEHQQRHSRESLAELLWPGQTTGRQNLRQTLSRLQKALDPPAGPSLLQATRQTIAFNPGAHPRVDVLDFAAALAAARGHAHPAPIDCAGCAQDLQAAVNLYRGELLADIFADSEAFDEWLLARRAWLEQEMLWALDALARRALARRDVSAALACARRQLAIDPLAESAHQQVMQALLLDGRRGEAQSHYDAWAARLADELNVAPAAATTALLTEGSGTSAAPRPTPPRPSHAPRLPQQFTPFIGREESLALLAARLADPTCRLLTLAGPGGMGKTRLAVEAARRQSAGNTEIHFLDLTPLDSAGAIPAALAAALGVMLPSHAQTEDERREALVQRLADRALLLILDNYEHLLPDTGLITDLLQETRQVRLLVTSRLPLHLRAEWIVDVEGLPVPPDERGDAEQNSEKYAALALFAQTAARVRHNFAPSPAEWQAVAHICRLVQGAPLALELAAARVREMPVAQIAAAIERDLDFLSTAMADVPARHRSLRAVIDHSWALLPPAQQAVFARLALFRDAFTADAAGAVAGASQAQLDALADSYLLRRADGGRYALHASLRQFAAEKLSAAPAVQAEIQRRHGSYYLSLLAGQEERLLRAEAPLSLALLRLDYNNLAAAWSWAAAQSELRLLDRALEALYRFTNASGLVQEGRAAVEEALRTTADGRPQTAEEETVAGDPRSAVGGPRSTDEERSLLRARLLAKQTRFLNLQGQYEQAMQTAEAGAQLLQPGTAPERGQETSGEILLQWGRAALHLGRYDESEDHLTKALETARRVGAQRLEAEIQMNLGTNHNFQNSFAAAIAHDDEALRLARACGDLYIEGIALNNLGAVADFQGEYAAAADYFAQALQVFDAVGYRRGSASALSNLGAASSWLGELEQALDCHSEGLHAARALGDMDGEAWALMALGAVLTHLGRLDEARNHLQAALEINGRDGTRTLEAWCLHHLSQVALAADELGEAETLAGRARVLAAELDDELTVAGALVVRGEVATRRREYAQAEECFRSALAINRRMGHTAGQMRVLAVWSPLALAQGDARRAVELAEEGLALDGRADLLLDRAPLLAARGRALAGLGEQCRAAEALKQALALYLRMGQTHLAERARAELAEMKAGA